MNRREWMLWVVGAFSGLLSLGWWLKKSPPNLFRWKELPITDNSPDFKSGHQLMKSILKSPSSTVSVKVLIIGAGVGGLSAGRILNQKGIDNYAILELEKSAGGNARYGTSQAGNFPFGAHYLSLPASSNRPLIQFLEEVGLVEGILENGLPVFNEEHICHQPEERLFIHGMWQEKLLPHLGVDPFEKEQMEKFSQLMNDFREMKGKDGLYAFDIPLEISSKDPEFLRLDNFSMKDYLHSHGFTSPALHWFVDYCCKDDFGLSHAETSAWAGVHYFASRRQPGPDYSHDDVFTWSQGNGWLVQHLEKMNAGKTDCRKMAFEINQKSDSTFEILALDLEKEEQPVIKYHCEHLILACPKFILSKMKSNIPAIKSLKSQLPDYSTWVTVNFMVNYDLIKERSGAPLSWDNVIFGSESLGFVNSQNQELFQNGKLKNFTWYYVVNHQKKPRKSVLKQLKEEWVNKAISELNQIYTGFESAIQGIDVCVWGHGMVQPKVGFKTKYAQFDVQMEENLIFAHTDSSGISIFEEAFHLGHKAGMTVAQELKVS